jgi:D-serine dehydratase
MQMAAQFMLSSSRPNKLSEPKMPQNMDRVMEELGKQVIPWGTKGLPPSAFGMSLQDVGHQNWNLLNDIPLPACILKRTAIEHNRRTMTAFLKALGLQIAPHGKSTMAPALFEGQLQDGAWGLTAATPAHLMTYRSFGVQRIIYANQLVDPVGIEFLLDELASDPDFECLCLVDSLAGARLLRDAVAARPESRAVEVLIEIGIPGTRCGVRTTEQALELAAGLKAMRPHLLIRGIEAFEGVVSIGPHGETQIAELLAVMKATLDALTKAEEVPDVPIVSIGGSAFYAMVANEISSWPEVLPILRSGCYITNDHGMYARAQQILGVDEKQRFASPLQPALEVWAHVQSRPEPGLAVLALGKRDISHDIEMPLPIAWVARGERKLNRVDQQFRVVGMNDQHASMTLPAEHPLAVGDLVMLGCSHPCTTFDKWRTILVADDDYNIVDAIATYF